MQGRIDAEHVVKEMMEKIKGEQDPKEEPQITDSDLENDENIQAMFAAVSYTHLIPLRSPLFALQCVPWHHPYSCMDRK